MSGSKCQMRKRKSICFHTNRDNNSSDTKGRETACGVRGAPQRMSHSNAVGLQTSNQTSKMRLACRKSFLFHPSQEGTDNGRAVLVR